MASRNPNRLWIALVAVLVAGAGLLLWAPWRDAPNRSTPQEKEAPAPDSLSSDLEGVSGELAGSATVSPAKDLAPPAAPGEFLSGRSHGRSGPRSVALEARRGRDLSSAAWLKGAVRTQDGEPIGGAILKLWEHIPNPPQPLASVESDAAGKYEIRALRPGRHRLTIERRGFAALVDYPELPAAGVLQKEFYLDPATASIRGRLTDEDDRPLANARVGASFSRVYTSASTEHFLPNETRSDSQGNFEIKGLPAATVSLSFVAEGFLLDGTMVPLTEGEQAYVRFRLKRGLSRELRVTDPEGAPIEWAILTCGGPVPFPSDAEGVVRIVLRPDESPVVNCSLVAPGYLARDIELDLKTKSGQAVLHPGPELRGVVLTPEGRPIPDAKVTVSGARHHYEGTVSSDLSGRFSIRLSRPPASTVSAASPGFVEGRLQLEEASDPNDIEIRLRRPDAGVFGRVVDSRGRPVRLFSVQLRDGDQIHRRSFNEFSGRFEIRDITAGRYEIFISSEQPELMSVAVRKEAVEILPGQFVGELTFRFPPPRDE